MIPLVIATLTSSLFTLTVKYSQMNRLCLYTVGAVNYTTATLIFLAISLPSGFPEGFTLIVGAIGGMAIVTAYFLLVGLMQLRGVSITSAVIRLSVLLPVLFSIFVWHEQPSIIQATGIILAILSLPFFGLDKEKRVGRVRIDKKTLFYTGLLLCVNGIYMMTIRFFHQEGQSERSAQFFFVMFTTAASIGWMIWFLQKKKVSKPDILPGVFLGLCNTGSGSMVLLSLQFLPGVVVFPLTSSVGLVITVIVARLVWSERLGGTGVFGIICAAIAAILMNLS